MINVEVVWVSKQIFVGSEKAPHGGYAKQWSVTASKQLGPHTFEKTLTVNQLGTPPVAICRALEHRAMRELQSEILFHRELDSAGMSEAG